MLAGRAALSFAATVACPTSESAGTESVRRASVRGLDTRALSLTATVVAGATDVALRRVPRHPAKNASTETVPSRANARRRERRGVTSYLVGILTGARPLQLRMQRNVVS